MYRCQHVHVRLIQADNLQESRSSLQKIFKHNVCNNNDFAVQTISETCVHQCVR